MTRYNQIMPVLFTGQDGDGIAHNIFNENIVEAIYGRNNFEENVFNFQPARCMLLPWHRQTVGHLQIQR